MAKMRDRTNGDRRVGGLNLDPGVAAQLRDTAALNQVALTAKQRRDRRRITIRLDLPGRWLKEALSDAAAREDISLSHLAAFLLAWALTQLAGDPHLRIAIDENRYVYRSLNAGHGLDPDGFQDLFTNPAEVRSEHL